MMEEVGNRPEPPQLANLLLNPVILKTVLEVAPLEILKDCRHVSREWWKLSLPRFRREFCVVIKEEHQFQEILEWVETPEDPFEFEKRPFKKYRIDGGSYPNMRVVELSPFWFHFGPKMKYLEIHRSKFADPEVLKKILVELTPSLEVLLLTENTYKYRIGRRWLQVDDEDFDFRSVTTQPNLKSFQIKERNFSRKTFFGPPIAGGCMNISWMQFLVHFPNLKEIYFDRIEFEDEAGIAYESPHPHDFFDVILKAIRKLRQLEVGSANLVALEKLDILNVEYSNALLKFPPTTLAHLQNLQFPLTSLTLDVGILTDESTLGNILQMYCKTLKSLKLARFPHAFPFHGFPFEILLEALTELQLSGTIAPNLMFLKLTPNLRILHLLNFYTGCPHKSIEDMDVPLIPHPCERNYFKKLDYSIVAPSLHEFVSEDELYTEKKVRMLAKLMPNLNRLKISTHFGTKTLRAVCNNWSKLISLEINSSKTMLTDDVTLNLDNLKDLQCLKLGVIFDSGDAVLSDIFELPHLLKLDMTCGAGVSDELFEKLVSKFPSPISSVIRKQM